MASFQGPLTSPAYASAAYGLLKQNRFLELYEDSKHRVLLGTVDLAGYTHVTTGDTQQGLQWDIILSPSSPLSRSTSTSSPGGSKLSSNFAKLRRKSSIGGAKAIEKFSQANAQDSPASPASASTASPSSSSSKSWLKSKLRSKSISASKDVFASLAMSPAVTAQQPLPENASVLIAKNNPSAATRPTSPEVRPSSANAVTETVGRTKASSPLVLSTISKELQSRWIDVLAMAIAICIQEARSAQKSDISSGMPSSSSLPSLAGQCSPPLSSPVADLSGYAFPRRPSPSPLRVTAATNQAILASSRSAATSPATSFLEMGPSSSSRSSTPSSRRANENGHDADSPRTAMPSPSASAHRHTSGTPNPLLPQWLSEVRRNSSGSFVLDSKNRYISRSSSPSPSPSPTSESPSPSANVPTMPSVFVERPTIRQSKSSSFLNLDPSRRELLIPSSPIHRMNEDALRGHRGIKISIHPDEEDENSLDGEQKMHVADKLSASQPARSPRYPSPPMSTTDSRSPSPLMPKRLKTPLSTSTSSSRNLGINFGDDSTINSNLSSSHNLLLRASSRDNFLRPSHSSTSLASSDGASSCYNGVIGGRGGGSVSSCAQSTDPPTPNPPYIENLGTPQSCELTPTYITEDQSKMKLQGYFGVPKDIVQSPPSVGIKSPSLGDKAMKEKKNRKEQNDMPSSKVPLHARLGNVFSSSASKSHRANVVAMNTSTRSSEDKESIKSLGSGSMSSISASNSSVTSPISSHMESAATSRKSSYDLPSERKPDIGRHIIDPAELRRLMQERLDSSTSSTGHGRNVRRGHSAGIGMKKSASLQAALDSHARSSAANERGENSLSASTSTSPDAIEYHKYTFGRAHPAQVPPHPIMPSSFSPAKERTNPIHTSSPAAAGNNQGRVSRSDSANSLAAQALFAALPPPKRRSAGPARPSTAGTTMPTLQEGAVHVN